MNTVAQACRHPSLSARDAWKIAVNLLLLLCWLLTSFSVLAKSSGKSSEHAFSVDERMLSAARSQVTNDKSLTQEQRTQALGVLDQAQQLLAQSQDLQTRLAALRNTIASSKQRIEQLQHAQPEPALKAEALQEKTTDALKQLLTARQTALERAKRDLSEQEAALTSYLAAAKNGGSELAQARSELDQLVSQDNLAKPEAVQQSPQQLLKHVRQQWLDSRIRWLQLRQDNLDLLTRLAQAERDAAAAQVQRLQQDVDLLRGLLTERKVTEAQQAEQTVQAQSAELDPSLAPLADKVAGLRREQTNLITRSASLEQRLEAIKSQLAQLQADRQRLQQAIELGASGGQLSKLLRNRRMGLPATAELSRELLGYQRELKKAVLRQFELDEQIRGGNEDIQLLRRLADGADSSDATPDPRLQQQARELLNRYQAALVDLLRVDSAYVARLSSTEETSRQLLKAIREFHAFIISKLLWTPSSEPFSLQVLQRFTEGVLWFTNPDKIRRFLEDERSALESRAVWVVLWVLLILLGLAWHKRAHEALQAAAEATRRVRTDSMAYSFSALLHTLILTLPLPVFFLGMGLLLGSVPTASEFTLRIAAGLQGAGHTALFFEFFRHLCRDQGFAQVHLGWNETLCRSLRIQAIWLLPIVTPLAFLFSTSAADVPSAFIQLAGIVRSDDPSLSVLGRIAFTLTMLLLAVAVRRIWGPNSPVVTQLSQHTPVPKWVRYHGLWFYFAWLLPVAFALEAIAGYGYTASYFMTKTGVTLWFFIIAIVAKDLLLRSLLVTRRRLRYAELLKAREQALAESTAAPESELPNVDEDKVDYGELGDQLKQLVRIGYAVGVIVGLWWIWRDVLPALDFLDRVTLPITTHKLIDGTEQTVHLTLGDLVLGLVAAGLTLLAARGVPGLLEFTLLQRVPLSRATRYAVTTLTQYIVVMLGLVMAFSAVGIQWSSVQWLVAALSVGLGFGLQEIVANFISGVILLFEQPIRVGDIVTVDGITGTVTRIRIRATTILNYDRQELVIPNKTFITGQLVNWTLSDTVNRIIITVGVAYGSDTRKALAIMQAAAQAHPKVLTDPPPRLTFEEFGDNALILRLRVYLDDMDVRLDTMTELHQAINDQCEAAGIVIAFPQRDIHMDTSQPLELILRRPSSEQS